MGESGGGCMVEGGERVCGVVGPGGGEKGGGTIEISYNYEFSIKIKGKERIHDILPNLNIN